MVDKMIESFDNQYFQDGMQDNVCFGCGVNVDEGLHVKSYWDGEESVCNWIPDPKYRGWANLLNGGILATIIDCHTICTAVAYAYKEEGRSFGTFPEYRYATGT